MLRGCGFIILCIIGFIGLSLLYYSLRPYFSEHAEKVTESRYVEGYILDVLVLDYEYDTTLWEIVPVIEYSRDGEVHVDTAHHLSKSETKVGYLEEFAYYHYRPDTRIVLEMDEDEPDNYTVREDLPVESIVQQIAAEFQTAFLIVGAILLIIFLRGLSKRFRYKEPPSSQRF